MVSTLVTPCTSHSASKAMKSESSIITTSSVDAREAMSVYSTMSLNKMVTESCLFRIWGPGPRPLTDRVSSFLSFSTMLDGKTFLRSRLEACTSRCIMSTFFLLTCARNLSLAMCTGSSIPTKSATPSSGAVVSCELPGTTKMTATSSDWLEVSISVDTKSQLCASTMATSGRKCRDLHSDSASPTDAHAVNLDSPTLPVFLMNECTSGSSDTSIISIERNSCW
mmetsp:Transcript_29125/g.68143  ORF Transcript_29125/g.68143 Transcript_29125/m.68143 type:complete len:224 (+) Transcript_29125:488-1159(+)